ncbi:hypothetical protein, partial [Gordonibacter sp.]
EHAFETMKLCVSAYLCYVRRIDTTLAEIAEDIARLEARLELMGVTYEGIGASASERDKLPEGLARAAELHDEWQGEMAHHADELAEAKRLCRSVHECRYVLWLHLVERRTWDATARKAGYSNAQTRRLAEVGVRELYAIMPERWRREPIPNAAPH